MSALQKISSQMTLIPQQDLREVEGMNAFFIIPAKAQVGVRRALHGSPAAREAPRRARRDRARDGPARSPRPHRAEQVDLWVSATSSSGARSSAEPRDDRLFALSTAAVTLETELGLKPAGRRPSPSSRSRRATSTASTPTSSRCSRPPAARRLGDRAEDRHLRLRVGDRPRPRLRGSGHGGARSSRRS